MTLERSIERLLFVGVAMLACLMPAQNDTWWHLRAGDVMLATHRVMLTDVFSYTVAGQPWANYEWLSEVVFAIVYRAGGLPGLTAVCAVAATASLVFVYALIPGPTVHRILLLAGVMAGVTLTWSVRPQVFSLLLLGMTLWLLQRRAWAPLPPLFLLWANLHGAVALGIVALAATLAAWALVERRCPRGLVVAGVLCGTATLLTPLGLSYWPEIAASILRSKTNVIAEWRAPDWPPAHLVFWVGAIALPLLLAARWKRLESPERWSLQVTALLMLVLALRSMRNISPFLMAAAPACGVLLAASEVPPTLDVERRRRVLPALILAVAIGGAAIYVWRTWQNPPPRMGWYPVSPAAARAIESCRGPIYNHYKDGGPIIYFAPRQPVMLDSRQDPYPVSLVQAEGHVEATGDYHGLFDSLGVNCAVIPPGGRLAARLRAGGWRERFSDPEWLVLERPGS